ncbi:MAG TPA: hypothetical protein PLL26_03315, partial [Candidatus Dojkabacteria bacterium]|nr:hypothetical protein [Candidatus Dojkabacteria bacterium]
IINESLEVYKDVKIDGNLFVGGTIETKDLKVDGSEVTRWRGVAVSHPSDAKEGDIYLNSTDNKVYIYGGGKWNALN